MAANGSAPPDVRLGVTSDDGIAASIFALVERGAARRPELVTEMRGRIELCFAEDLAPVRLAFEEGVVVVEDGAWDAPDLRISGRLPHVVALTVAPLVGGVPNPATVRGRSALAKVAGGAVRVEGDRALGRRLLRLLAIR
ncbi:MAG: hypothetical protein QOH11_536 [Solirubrobacteraceae bacterium]|jgi:hypothetical protein|nr:hypothetical protein [Solirubrobacteraceae bacterium]